MLDVDLSPEIEARLLAQAEDCGLSPARYLELLVITESAHLQSLASSGEASQDLLDRAAAADENEGIRQGLEDEAAGRSRPIEEFLAEFREKHNLQR